VQGYSIIDSYSENEIPKDGKRSTIQLVHEMGLEKLISASFVHFVMSPLCDLPSAPTALLMR
jgi:hypothetical protein